MTHLFAGVADGFAADAFGGVEGCAGKLPTFAGLTCDVESQVFW